MACIGLCWGCCEKLLGTWVRPQHALYPLAQIQPLGMHSSSCHGSRYAVTTNRTDMGRLVHQPMTSRLETAPCITSKRRAPAM